MNISEWVEPISLCLVVIGLFYIYYVGRKIKKGKLNV